MFKLILTSLITFVILESESSKILGVFPIPSISHQVVFRPLMLEMAKRGHEVTVITTDPAFPKGKTPQNLTEIDVHNVSYGVWHKYAEENGNVKDRILFFELLFELLTDVFKQELESEEVQNFLKEDKTFDLLIVESCVRPALVFSHIYNIPVIEFSSLSSVFLSYELIGAATHPILYPDSMHKRIYNLSIWEKIIEVYVHYSSNRLFREHVRIEDKMLQKMFGPSIPSLNELVKNVQMLFLNVHPLWDFNRPVPPNVLYLGGMHQKPEQDLPKEWNSYLDFSNSGVIYVSFGTNVKPSMLPQDKLNIFLNVFSQLPYDVLWKWDKDELLGRSENVKISKWLPQSDLLRHPKVKLFITQGGLQSTDEALTAGVPLIGVPIFGDQFLNVEHYVKFNIGKKLDIETFTADDLIEAIKTVINDRSYRENVIKLRNIMHDQPFSSLECAVWWTEYVLRHKGADHLRTPSAHMSWAEYYELDLVLSFIVSAIVVVTVVVMTIRCVASKVFRYTVTKVKTN